MLKCFPSAAAMLQYECEESSSTDKARVPNLELLSLLNDAERMNL